MPIESSDFQLLVDHLAAEAPDLVGACRWLACGPSMAPLILGQDAAQPSDGELARLAASIETGPPEAAAAGRALLATHGARASEVTIALSHLIAAGEEWSHPTQILGRPCVDFNLLHTACLERIEAAVGHRRRRLEGVRDKLERAVRLEVTAKRRREGSS